MNVDGRFRTRLRSVTSRASLAGCIQQTKYFSLDAAFFCCVRAPIQKLPLENESIVHVCEPWMMTSGQRAVLSSCTICRARHEGAECRNPKRLEDNSVRKSEDADARTRRAFSQTEASLRSRRVLEAGFDALALLNIGLIICSASGHVLACNVPAQALLTARQGLEQAADDTLVCTEPAAPPISENHSKGIDKKFPRHMQQYSDSCNPASSSRPTTDDSGAELLPAAA